MSVSNGFFFASARQFFRLYFTIVLCKTFKIYVVTFYVLLFFVTKKQTKNMEVYFLH